MPKHFMKKWEFDVLDEAEAFAKSLRDQGRHIDGHKRFTKEDDGSITEIRNENGKFEVIYCPVGEMVVKCVEKAAQMMGSPVHITGDYLTGTNWATCH